MAAVRNLFIRSRQPSTPPAKYDGKLLKRELDRLARVLPLFDFLRLLSEMNNVEHPHDSVADGVLNDLCTTYQAMLAPVA